MKHDNRLVQNDETITKKVVSYEETYNQIETFTSLDLMQRFSATAQGENRWHRWVRHKHHRSAGALGGQDQQVRPPAARSGLGHDCPHLLPRPGLP